MKMTDFGDGLGSALTLEEAQAVALGVLDELDTYCRSNGIEYFLIGGALIGAVRGGDLVPWDDDIDVAMKRYDYERFCNEYVDNKRFSLLTYKRAKNYRHGMAKLVDTSTIFVEPVARDDPYGVFVDIFPLDYVTSDDDEGIHAIQRDIRIYTYSHLNTPEATSGNLLKSGIRKVLTATKGRGSYIQALERIEAKMIAPPSPFLANYWGAWGEKEQGPVKWFENTVEVVLRGHKYTAPVGYHEWLTRVYGDYMMPPTDMPHYHGKAYMKAFDE